MPDWPVDGERGDHLRALVACTPTPARPSHITTEIAPRSSSAASAPSQPATHRLPPLLANLCTPRSTMRVTLRSINCSSPALIEHGVSRGKLLSSADRFDRRQHNDALGAVLARVKGHHGDDQPALVEVHLARSCPTAPDDLEASTLSARIVKGLTQLRFPSQSRPYAGFSKLNASLLHLFLPRCSSPSSSSSVSCSAITRPCSPQSSAIAQRLNL